MRKSIIIINYTALGVLLFSTSNVVFAKAQKEFLYSPIIAKYIIVLFVLVLFFLIITIGLSLYNKFFVSSNIKDYQLSKDSLHTPSDKDDAIIKFITRNKL